MAFENGVTIPTTNEDGQLVVTAAKPFHGKAKSFVSVDYSNKCTWWYDSADVVAGSLTDSGDQLTYNFTHQNIINKKWITDRGDITGKDLVFYEDAVVIPAGDIVSIDYGKNDTNASVTFSPARTGAITADYAYAQTSLYELIPDAGKVIKLVYVETQFSAGTAFPADDYMVFDAIYHDTAFAPLGIPEDTDVVVNHQEYHTAADYMNKGNHGTVLKAFGELTQDINVFPWNYLVGNTLHAPASDKTDITKSEFNKIAVKMNNDTPYGNCEIATATFYVLIEDA